MCVCVCVCVCVCAHKHLFTPLFYQYQMSFNSHKSDCLLESVVRRYQLHQQAGIQYRKKSFGAINRSSLYFDRLRQFSLMN